jgi:MFS family permease
MTVCNRSALILQIVLKSTTDLIISSLIFRGLMLILHAGSLMNGLQSLTQWKAYFNNPEGSTLGVVNAAQSIGSVIALPFVGTLSDKIGRKWTLLIGAVTIIIASIIQAASVNYGMFVFARILVGVGSMLVVQPAPMLITELCYPTHRGKYTSLFWTLYYGGAILASWTTFGTQNHPGNWSWRIPSVVQVSRVKFPIRKNILTNK